MDAGRAAQRLSDVLTPSNAPVMFLSTDGPFADRVVAHLAWDGMRVERVAQHAFVERVRREQDRVVVIIEHALPELDAIDVCRWLRLTGAEHHILLLGCTGELFLEAREAGADDWFVGEDPTAELSTRVRTGRKAALRRRRRDRGGVTVEVADEWTEPSQALLDRAAAQVAQIAEAQAGFLFRFEDRRVVLLGRSGAEESPHGSWFPLLDDGVLSRALTGSAARVDQRPRPIGREQSGNWYIRQTYVSAVAAPVRMGRRVWGALVAASTTGEPMRAGAELDLARFADVNALALVNAATRVRIGQLERSDLLTGLLSRDVFDRRLGHSVDLANAAGLHLSLVVFEVDGFAALVAGQGERTAGFVLAEVARRLELASRAGDVLGRIGDGRFGWVLQQTDGEMARQAAERMRACFAGSTFPQLGRVTLSAGVAGLAEGEDADRLLARTGSALTLAGMFGDACRVAPCIENGERITLITRP